MTGTETLIAMRQRRLRPAAVAVHVGFDRPAPHPEVLELAVRPDEAMDRLDLRCLLGLDVIVTADAEEGHQRALRAMCMAAVTAGARRVIGVEFRRVAGVPTTEVFRHGVH